MRKLKKLSALLLSAALIITSLQLPGCRKEAKAAAFRDYSAEEITEAMGAGWNLGNQMESVNSWSGPVPFPDETAWGNPKVTKDLIAAVRKAGFKSVRIPVSYLSKIGSKADGYEIDEAWLNRLEEIVGYVTANGMYAIINIHGDGYSTVSGGWLLPGKSDTQQKEIKEKYKACWEQIAEKFKDQSEKVIFESMNEVGADADTKDMEEVAAYYKNINEYNQIFVDAVRQSGGNNDKRWLLIPGLNTNVDMTADDCGFQIPEDSYRSDTIPADEQRIMVSVHYYDPWDFCGSEDFTVTQWGIGADDSSRAATEGLEEYMEQQFAKLKTVFVDKGYPVVIGEYGCVDKTQVKAEDIASGKFDVEDADKYNNEYRAYYTEVLNMMAKRYSCIPVYWDNGYNGAFGLGIFNRSTYTITQPGIVKAIMKTYKTSTDTITGISLDQTSLRMCMGDDSVQLTATLEPENADGSVFWGSSDSEVAAVSQRGKVDAKSVGTAVITATVDGKQAYCIVHVSPAERFRAKLYYNSVMSGWNYATICSNDYVTVEATQGGTYTLQLNGVKERMTHINTLYLKDVLGNDGQIENSVIGKATVTIDSLKMNDYECTMTKNPFLYDASELDSSGNPKSIFDICLINIWDETYVEGYSNGSLPAEAYVDGTNTLTLTFTLSDIELSDKREKEIEPEGITISQDELEIKKGQEGKLTAQLTPDDTTYKPVWLSDDPAVASVSKDGTVKGVSVGTTTIHVFSGNGMEKTCTVSVSAEPVDLTALQALTDKAEQFVKSEYTESSYSRLEAALTEAKALLDSSDPESEEADRVKAALETAISHLIQAETFTQLTSLTEEAAEQKEEEYTESSWQLYQNQITEAQKALLDENAEQADLENILQNLQEAKAGLLTKKTQTAISDTIQSAKTLQSSEYTADSWKVLEAALAAAEKAYAENTLGEAQMQSLLEALQAAVSSLKKADGGGTVQNPPSQNPDASAAPQDPGQTTEPQDTDSESAFQNKKVTLSKVASPKKKTVQVTWKKLAGAKGYEITLATNKKFTKNKKKVTVQKAATKKMTVKKLKAGKKYYVRIRAWQTVSGKKQYSKWSAVKSVKVKK